MQGNIASTEILRVHGTAAALDADHGEAWWQTGSLFEERLNAAADKWAFCSAATFHWSGQNSARARALAARKLLDDFVIPREFGAAGFDGPRPYALVGHSHGGSIIEEMLFEARRRGVELQRLVAIVSVGTPFLRREVPLAAAAYMLPLVAGLTGVVIGTPLLMAGASHFSAVIEEGDVAAAAVAFVAWVGLLLLSLVSGYIVGAAAMAWFTAGARLQRKVRSAFGTRWLSIASEDDEAIRTLRSAATLNQRLVPKVAYPFLPRRSPLWMWAAWIALSPALLPLSAIVWGFNEWMVPLLLNPLLLQVIKDRAFGDDQLGLKTRRVEPHFVGESLAQLDLGDVTSLADSRLAKMVPRVRRAVLERFSAIGGVVPGSGSSIDSLTTGLVHCSYLEEDDVVSAIALHVRRIAGDSNAAVVPREPTAEKESGRGNQGTGHFVVSIGLMTVAMIFASATSMIGAAYLQPHTAHAQKTRILTNHPRFVPKSLGDDTATIADWLQVVVAAGAFDAYLEALTVIPPALRPAVLSDTAGTVAAHGGLEALDAACKIAGGCSVVASVDALAKANRPEEARRLAWRDGPLTGEVARARLHYAALTHSEVDEALAVADQQSCLALPMLADLRRIHGRAVNVAPAQAAAVLNAMKRARNCQPDALSHDQATLQVLGAAAQSGDAAAVSAHLTRLVRSDFAWAPAWARTIAAEERSAWAAFAQLDPHADRYQQLWLSVTPAAVRHNALRRGAAAWLEAGHVETAVALAEMARTIADEERWGGFDFCGGEQDYLETLQLSLAALGRSAEVTRIGELLRRSGCNAQQSGRSHTLEVASALYLAGRTAEAVSMFRSDASSRLRATALLDLAERVAHRGRQSEELRELITQEFLPAEMSPSNVVIAARLAEALAVLDQTARAREISRRLAAQVESWQWGEDRPDARIAVCSLLARVRWYQKATRIAERADVPQDGLRANAAALRTMLRAEANH